LGQPPIPFTVGRYFWIRQPAASEVIEWIEGRWYEEVRLRKEIEHLREKVITEF